MQLLGLALLLLNAALVMKVASKLTPQRPVPYLALVCVLGQYPLAYWSLLGMETSFVACCLTGLSLCAIRQLMVQSPEEKDYTAAQSLRAATAQALLSAALYLSRPDAAVYAILIIGVQLFLAPRKRPALCGLGGLLLTVTAHFLIRYGYYGNWLPNTAVLKLSRVPLLERWRNGLGFLGGFFGWAWPLALLAALGVVRSYWIARHMLPPITLGRDHSKALLLALFVTACGYQIHVGGDPWPYWRILAPTLPLIAMLAAVEVTRFSSGPGPASRKRAWAISGFMLLVLAAQNRPFAAEILGARPPSSVPQNKRNVAIADALNQVLSADASLGVFWAGAIPYYTSRYTHDFLGKAEPVLARRAPDLSGAVSWSGMNSVPGHNKYDLEFSIQQQQPTFVQGARWGAQDITAWVADHYARVSLYGTEFWLKYPSNNVHWEQLYALGAEVAPPRMNGRASR